MTRPERYAAGLLLTIGSLAVFQGAVCAQAAPLSVPRGSHDFAVHGSYEGDAMPLWQALLQLSDSTLAGRPAVYLQYRTRLDGNQYRFNYSVLWRADDPSSLRARWQQEGRPGAALEPGQPPSSCEVVVAADSMHVSTSTGMKLSRKAEGAAVPEFALATVLATRPLAAGDTVRYHAFRCSLSAEAPQLLSVFDFTGIVRSATLRRRADAEPEPVWLIEGVGNYAFKTWIARSDRQVLQVVLPQGYVGWMTETYLATRAQ